MTFFQEQRRQQFLQACDKDTKRLLEPCFVEFTKDLCPWLDEITDLFDWLDNRNWFTFFTIYCPDQLFTQLEERLAYLEQLALSIESNSHVIVFNASEVLEDVENIKVESDNKRILELKRVASWEVQ